MYNTNCEDTQNSGVGAAILNQQVLVQVSLPSEGQMSTFQSVLQSEKTAGQSLPVLDYSTLPTEGFGHESTVGLSVQVSQVTHPTLTWSALINNSTMAQAPQHPLAQPTHLPAQPGTGSTSSQEHSITQPTFREHPIAQPDSPRDAAEDEPGRTDSHLGVARATHQGDKGPGESPPNHQAMSGPTLRRSARVAMQAAQHLAITWVGAASTIEHPIAQPTSSEHPIAPVQTTTAERPLAPAYVCTAEHPHALTQAICQRSDTEAAMPCQLPHINLL